MEQEGANRSNTSYSVHILADMIKQEKMMPQILPYRTAELAYFFAVISKQVHHNY